MSKNTLVIGDTHCPCMHEGYVDHLRDVYRQWGCEAVIHIGDVVELQSFSFHERDPDLPSPGDELRVAQQQVQMLGKAFPKLTVLTGNHDALPARQAKAAGIPSYLVRSPREFLETPSGWQWWPRQEVMLIGNVLYAHGDIYSKSASQNASHAGRHYVQGHHHSQAGATWVASETNLVFGLDVGCGVDRHARAMMYGKGYRKKPILGCGVVVEGRWGVFEPMDLG